MQQVGRWVIPNKGGWGKGGGLRATTDARQAIAQREGLARWGFWGASAQPTKARDQRNSGKRLTCTCTHLPFTPTKSDMEGPSKRWSCRSGARHGELAKMEGGDRAPGICCVCRAGCVLVKASGAFHTVVIDNEKDFGSKKINFWVVAVLPW